MARAKYCAHCCKDIVGRKSTAIYCSQECQKRAGYARDCEKNNKRNRVYYLANREKIIERGRAYRAANREKLLEDNARIRSLAATIRELQRAQNGHIDQPLTENQKRRRKNGAAYLARNREKINKRDRLRWQWLRFTKKGREKLKRQREQNLEWQATTRALARALLDKRKEMGMESNLNKIFEQAEAKIALEEQKGGLPL